METRNALCVVLSVMFCTNYTLIGSKSLGECYRDRDFLKNTEKTTSYVLQVRTIYGWMWNGARNSMIVESYSYM